MVASKVTVESKSYSDAVNAVWSSADGAESYSLGEGGSKTTRGTRVVLDLKEDAEEYLQPSRLREVVQKYSSFVSFPIEIDGELANTTGAVWAQDPREVDEKTYESFYRATFKGAWDAPTYLPFPRDAPWTSSACCSCRRSTRRRAVWGGWSRRSVLLEESLDRESL